MDTAACYACGTRLSDRAVYCPECARQIRCQACRELLEPNAKACVVCGTFIGQGNPTASATADGNGSDGRAQNRLRLEESRTNRSLDIVFTDNAVESLSDSLGSFILSGMATATARSRRHPHPEISEAEDDALEVVATPKPEPATPTMLPAATVQPEVDRLRRIFQENESQLRLDETRLKGTSRQNSARRLAYLRLLYAEVIEKRDHIEKNEIINIINSADWLDNSTSNRIFDGNNDFLITGNSVGLRASGRDEARKMLSDVFDDGIPQDWSLGDLQRKRSTKTAKTEERQTKDEAKGSSRKSKKPRLVPGWVEAWKKINLSVDGHMTLKDCSVVDQGIFGMWAIRHAVGDEGKVVTGYALASFLWEAFEIKVDPRNLVRTLKSSENAKGKVETVDGTRFQIVPTGIKYAETMAGL